MINSLHLRNFKGIRQAELRLERLTVIVGPNASGKTSFLEALHYLSMRETLDPSLLYRRGANGEEMELSCSGVNGTARFHNVTPDNSYADETFLEDDQQQSVTGRHIKQTLVPVSRQETQGFAKKLRPANLLRFDVARMVDPLLGSGTRMGDDGTGLSAALAFMALNQPDDFQTIQHLLRLVVTTVERIRFDYVKLFDEKDNDVIGHAHKILFDFRGARDIPANLASEGTILVLGLLTALMGNKRPDLILLDDLDRGLHPKAQREVVSLLRTILEQNPELQIVATSHSPYLVDSLRPEEVRLTTLDEDGTVSIASLVEHPDFDKWKDEMAPGEMWSLFGESWVSQVSKVAGGE